MFEDEDVVEAKFVVPYLLLEDPQRFEIVCDHHAQCFKFGFLGCMCYNRMHAYYNLCVCTCTCTLLHVTKSQKQSNTNLALLLLLLPKARLIRCVFAVHNGLIVAVEADLDAAVVRNQLFGVQFRRAAVRKLSMFGVSQCV